jgi:hypothetical protein
MDSDVVTSIEDLPRIDEHTTTIRVITFSASRTG